MLGETPTLRGFADVMNAWEGKEVKGMKDWPLFKRMLPEGKQTDAEAFRMFQKLAFRHGLVGSKQGLASEFIGDAVDSISSQVPGLGKGKVNPIKGKFTPAPEGSSFFDKYLNPAASRDGLTVNREGLANVETDVWAPYRMGRDVGEQVEFFNRIMPFMQQLKKGVAPDAAADFVNRAQVDYSQLSAFERQYARLAFPFYTFTRRMSETVVDELIARPGGPMAQVIRASNNARDKDALAPEYILETAAIPVGSKSDGSQSYMTGFGLAHEDVLNLLNGPMRLSGEESFRELAGRSAPFIKAPIEISTNESLFQRGPSGGRDLDDVDPTLGRIRSNIGDMFTGERTQDPDPVVSQGFEYLVGNSPASRFANTARTLTDSRKWEDFGLGLGLNLLTGARVTDVSPIAQDAIANERIGNLMKELGSRQFKTDYLPESKRENLSEEEKELLELLKESKKVLNKRFQKRREEKAKKLI